MRVLAFPGMAVLSGWLGSGGHLPGVCVRHRVVARRGVTFQALVSVGRGSLSLGHLPSVGVGLWVLGFVWVRLVRLLAFVWLRRVGMLRLCGEWNGFAAPTPIPDPPGLGTLLLLSRGAPVRVVTFQALLRVGGGSPSWGHLPSVRPGAGSTGASAGSPGSAFCGAGPSSCTFTGDARLIGTAASAVPRSPTCADAVGVVSEAGWFPFWEHALTEPSGLRRRSPIPDPLAQHAYQPCRSHLPTPPVESAPPGGSPSKRRLTSGAHPTTRGHHPRIRTNGSGGAHPATQEHPGTPRPPGAELTLGTLPLVPRTTGPRLPLWVVTVRPPTIPVPPPT